MKHQFITFEGGEGSGKSTQVRLFVRRLREQGHTVCETREPGGTELGNALRNALLHTRIDLAPRAEALLFSAARAQLVYEVIRPALDNGATVVCDRYVDSTLAYQGGGRQPDFSTAWLEDLAYFATNNTLPSLTFYLDIDPAEGMKRKLQIGPKDRIESNDLDFHHRVWNAYRSPALIKSIPRRTWVTIDASRGVMNVHQQIVQEWEQANHE